MSQESSREVSIEVSGGHKKHIKGDSSELKTQISKKFELYINETLFSSAAQCFSS